MKKKLLGGIAVFVMAAVVAINVNLVIPKQNNLSSLVLANLEALGRNESGGNSYDYPDGRAYSSICNVEISKWRRCKVEIVLCQGGGTGCNEKDCPVHK